MIASLGSVLVDFIKLVAALVVLVVMLALLSSQALLLGSLLAAPFGWSVPLIALPTSITDLAVIVLGIAGNSVAVAGVAKLNEKI